MAEPASVQHSEGLNWVEACPLDALERRGLIGVCLHGEHLVVAISEGAIFAAERKCPHESADLAKGRCQGGRLMCPRHLAWFDLRTGEVPGWDVRKLRIFPTRVDEARVFVGLPRVPKAPIPPEPF
ncbi:Rieske (2Fe-2S) protein [Terrihabitans sp. B22-R8]|uniref:Rieske (2Fe-2S) protein n=1 Tax=Terrihabitans sp. B22-R8 TaxID=3425128 RepID=UPI00403C4C76